MTDIEKQKAEAEIAKWFWQPAEGHNFRYKYAVRTLTRFYEMVTPAADTLRLILEYLRTQEISGSISLLGKQVDLGSGWTAKDAWYQTATGDQFANTKQDKVRVYQTLMLASDDSAEGDGPYTVEDGCQYAVDHTFYWNVAELPTMPASSSGIQYTMQGVTRESDTGLFSCVVEKRERVQQNVALYDTAKTIFETVKEEQHLGVKASAVPTTGQSASAADGVLVKRQLRKNPDCTTDVINEVTEEEPVSDSVKQYRKTLRGTIETTTDRNQEDPLNGTNLNVGETRRSEKTPGGLYNNTTEAVTTEAAGEIAHDCQKTIFEHTDETVTNQLTEPSNKEATAAGSGKTYRKNTRKTEEGTFDITERETTEEPVSDALVKVEKTWEGVIKTTQNRNQNAPASTTVSKPGSSVTNEKTPGGRYNQTIVEADETPLGVKGRVCEKTIFEHRDTEIQNVPDDPGEQHGSAANGTIVQKSAEMTRFGTWDKKQITLVEQPVSSAVVQFQKTLRGTVKIQTDRNQTNPLNDGTGTGGTPMEIGETRRSEKTPGGLYNNTVEKRTTDPAGKIVDGKDVETVRSTEFSTTNQATDPGEISVSSEVNKSKRKVSRKTDAGNWDVEEQETEYTPVQTLKTWTDERGTHAYCSYRNQTQPITPAAPQSGTWDTSTVSFSENDHGSFDGSYTAFQNAAPSESGKTLQYETEADVETKFYYQKAGGEIVFRQITGKLHLAYGLAKHILSKVKDAEECALVGWRTDVGDGPGIVTGKWYTNITIDSEQKDN